MFRTLCVVAFFTFMVGVNMSQATTLHRLPLAYVPYNINAWKDVSATVGVDIRYDNITISSG